MPDIETPAQANEETVNVVKEQFRQLDDLIDKTHPKYKEYEKLQNNAQQTFQRMEKMLTMPGVSAENFRAFVNGARDLQKLYEQCVNIHAEMVYDKLKRTFNVDKTSTVEKTLFSEVRTAFGPFQSDEFKSIEARLQTISETASKQPVDMLNGTAEGGAVGYYYLDRATGKIFPNFRKLEGDIQSLEEDEKTFIAQLGPGATGKHAQRVLQIIGKLKAGLQEIQRIDPQSLEIWKWQQSLNIDHDMRPLRLMLMVSGGLCSVLGIGMALKGKGISPSTGLWMTVAVLAARPDLFRGGDEKVLESIRALDHEKLHEFLTEHDWKDDKGIAAFKQIQDVREDETFIGLVGQNTVNKLQIEQLFKKKSPAFELLTSDKMSDSNRAEALHLFGSKYDDGQKEMIEWTLRLGEFGIAKAAAGTL